MLKQVNKFQDHAWGWVPQTFGQSFWKYMQRSVSACFLVVVVSVLEFISIYFVLFRKLYPSCEV